MLCVGNICWKSKRFYTLLYYKMCELNNCLLSNHLVLLYRGSKEKYSSTNVVSADARIRVQGSNQWQAGSIVHTTRSNYMSVWLIYWPQLSQNDNIWAMKMRCIKNIFSWFQYAYVGSACMNPCRVLNTPWVNRSPIHNNCVLLINWTGIHVSVFLFTV